MAPRPNARPPQRLRFAIGAALILLLFAGGSPAAAGGIYAVLIADTEDEQIGLSCEVDLLRMSGVVYGGFAEDDFGEARELKGEDVTPDRILEAVRGAAARSGPDDALLVYYSGHGTQDRTLGHVLKTPGGNLPREAIRSALAADPARLTVLLTDTCSVHVGPAGGAVGMIAPSPGTTPALRALFLEAEGFVDLSASAPGEFAVGDRGGGYFTAALTNYLNENRLRPLTWEQVVKDVRIAASRRFRQRFTHGLRGPDLAPRFAELVGADYRQATQTLYRRRAPGAPGGETVVVPGELLLGVQVAEDPQAEGGSPRSGVRVLRVFPDTPVTRWTRADPDAAGGDATPLMPDDRILRIDGRTTGTEAQFQNALNQVGPIARLRVRDRRGAERSYLVPVNVPPDPEPRP